MVGQAVAVGQHQQFVCQRLLSDGFFPSQAVIGGQGGQQGFVEERDLGNLRRLRRGGQQRRIEPVVAQALDQQAGLVFPKLDRQPRIGLAQGFENHGHEVRSQGGNHAQLERPHQRVAGGARHRLHLRGLSQSPLGMGQDLAAHRSHDHALVGTLDQGDAQLLFQLADLAAQGRLADVAGLGRPAKMPLLGHRHQVAKFL